MYLTMAMDPEALLHLARSGDAAACGRLLELYRNYLTLLARLHIGSRLQGKVEAADLVQETYLQAHRHFGRFEGVAEAELMAWLRSIMASRLAKALRRYFGTKARDPRLECDLAEELDRSSRSLDPALWAGGSSPSERASRREQALLLADALENLPADYREVLILRHLHGLTFPEVARQMGRTEDSVYNLWARALPQLRRLLGDTV